MIKSGRSKPSQDGTGQFSLAGTVQEGENLIELKGSGEVCPVLLTGEFDVLSSGGGQWYVDGAKMPGLGSLAAQGLPFYRGQVAYRRWFEVTASGGKRMLHLSRWKGRSCEVWVNYEKVADVTLRRFRMDIGPFLVPGANEVEIRISAPEPSFPGAPSDFGLFKEFHID